ncbi:hypothetical protein EGW08_010451, partial [Elysia chlorotica]
AVWMLRLDVQEMGSRVLCCVAAVLTHVQLGASLFWSEGYGLDVHLAGMGLQGASLCESLAAVLAFVGPDTYPHTCVSSCVPLEIEGVVEALATDPAQVPLVGAVVFQVSVQKTLEIKRPVAYMALWFAV